MADSPEKPENPRLVAKRATIEQRQARVARVMMRKAEKAGNAGLVASLARDHKFLREAK